MACKKYLRIDVALEQLNMAIDLFLSEKSYIAALTLAGAAEEILGKALKHEENENAIDESFSIALYFEKATKELRSTNFNEGSYKKDFFSGVNKDRNNVKHWSNPLETILEVDFKESAKEMLVRACRNCDLLEIEHTESIVSFNDWFWMHES